MSIVRFYWTCSLFIGTLNCFTDTRQMDRGVLRSEVSLNYLWSTEYMCLMSSRTLLE